MTCSKIINNMECKQTTESEIQIQKLNELLENRPYRTRRKVILKGKMASKGNFFLVVDFVTGKRKLTCSLEVKGGGNANQYFAVCEQMFEHLMNKV